MCHRPNDLAVLLVISSPGSELLLGPVGDGQTNRLSISTPRSLAPTWGTELELALKVQPE
jgi:hypothetical protein